jgi:hypothetical protein
MYIILVSGSGWGGKKLVLGIKYTMCCNLFLFEIYFSAIFLLGNSTVTHKTLCLVVVLRLQLSIY